MKKVFADAAYFIAQLNPRDQLNARARAVSAQLGRARFVTTEMVLTEVLAFFADKGSHLREAAALSVERLRSDPNVTILPQTSVQFQQGLARYKQYRDKNWSLTDCTSFLAMSEENINEALTHDEHFEQAGFRALLREE